MTHDSAKRKEVIDLLEKTRRYEIRFTEDEFAVLSDRARQAGLPRAEFVRRAIRGTEVKPAPTPDVMTLIRDIRRAGYALNEIMKAVHARGLLDIPQLLAALEDVRAAAQAVLRSYL